MTIRPRNKTLLMSASLACVLAFASNGLAQSDPRSLTPEMIPMAEVHVPDSALEISAWINRADGLYTPGEAVALTLRSTEDAWITVLATDARGRTTVVFPNMLHRDGFIAANSMLSVPGPGADWQLTVNPPFGANMITVIAATAEVDLLGGLAVVAAGPFRSIDSGAADLARHLSVEMTAKPDAHWSSARIDFAVVESRDAMGAQPFALSLETDRDSYAIGEAVTLRLTAERECALTVVNVNHALNEAVVLYPNMAIQEVRLPAGETVRLPGADASLQLLALGPVGPQTLTARCEADGAQSVAQFSANPARGIYPVLTLNEWTLFADRPTVAEASVTFTVRP